MSPLVYRGFIGHTGSQCVVGLDAPGVGFVEVQGRPTPRRPRLPRSKPDIAQLTFHPTLPGPLAVPQKEKRLRCIFLDP